MYIAIGLFSFALLFTLALGKRNNLVFEYRSNVLKQITEMCDEDICNQRPWRWRLDMLETVSYDEMLYKFWRPFSSFFPDEMFGLLIETPEIISEGD